MFIHEPLAQLLAKETHLSPHALLYSRSLHWPLTPITNSTEIVPVDPTVKGQWFDFIQGTDQLPDEHSEFIVSHRGEICLLLDLVQRVKDKFIDGQRDLATLWQGNDARSDNQPLAERTLSVLKARFPSFKLYYDHIASVILTDTPLGKLQALRDGLYKGSVKGAGTDYDAAPPANEAISLFAPWWEKINQASYAPNKSLRQALGELPTGGNAQCLEALLAIIVRETSANVSSSSDGTTCVELRGGELERAIKLNRAFLLTFEQHDLTDAKLTAYQSEIIAEVRAYQQQASFITQSAPYPVFLTPETNQSLYFPFAFSQLWYSFFRDDVSSASLLELKLLVNQLSYTQRQNLLFFPSDFSHFHTSESALRGFLQVLEGKLEKNILLPPAQQHPLSKVDQAILTLLASNLNLLAWVSSHFEFILFSQPSLIGLAFEYGLPITNSHGDFILQDDFNLAYYVHKKLQPKKENFIELKRALQTQLAITHYADSTPNSPLHRAIIKHDRKKYEALLESHVSSITHIDWRTGNSSLAIAALHGQAALCRWLLKAGVDPTLKNKKGKTAEELWPSPDTFWPRNPIENPFIVFHQSLIALARNTGTLNEEQRNLFELIIKQTHLLTWQVKADPSSFLQEVFLINNQAMISPLIALPEWPQLSINTGNMLSLLHIIASIGALDLYPYLNRIHCNDQQNKLNRTPLHYAALQGHEAFCRLLIAQGADINLQDREGHTALMLTAFRVRE